MERTAIKDIINKENSQVVVAGWVQARRDHGKIIFIDLRDASGILQTVFAPQSGKAAAGQVPIYNLVQEVRTEWVVKITGTVQKRPEKMRNPKIATGDFELSAESLEILSKAETPPFPIEGDGYDVAEDIRWKYRYLDIRRPRVLAILRKRAEMKKFIWDFLSARGFIEVDTPILTKSTPEGARDFLVPSRLHPGKFYALPQSPQQYKQLLMIGGIEKYFQFPRCFRDEDLRGDRVLEFDQLDIEMSFIDREDVLNLVEDLVIEVSEKVIGKKIQERPFPRLSYEEVITTYKSDKPDLRKDKNSKNLLSYAWVVDFPMFEKLEDGRIDAVHHPFTAMSDEDLEKLDDQDKLFDIKAKQYDLVLNGNEIFGGSIRTSDPKIISKVFKILGHSDEAIQERFGHLLSAFSYGVPPHGGIAAGFDRWLMAMLGEPSIREVIPFPTSGSGAASVMDAPSIVDKKQLSELHIRVIQ